MHLTSAKYMTSVCQKKIPWNLFMDGSDFFIPWWCQDRKENLHKIHIFHDDSLRVLATANMILKRTMDQKHLEHTFFNLSKNYNKEQVSGDESQLLLGISLGCSLNVTCLIKQGEFWIVVKSATFTSCSESSLLKCWLSLLLLLVFFWH